MQGGFCTGEERGGGAEEEDVFVEGALEGEDADGDGGHWGQDFFIGGAEFRTWLSPGGAGEVL